MTTSLRGRVVAGAVTAVLAATGLVAATTATAQAAGDPTLLRQDASIAWYGSSYGGHATATVVVPGIGTAQLVCSRDRTWLEIRPSDRTKETQMWSAVYQTKTSGGVPYQSVAVKTARVYKYSVADDPGDGGTGPTAREGFNKYGPIENSSSGYIRGVISQRPGQARPAAAASIPPATSFYLTWDWSGYKGSTSKSRCDVRGTFTTRLGSYGADGTRAVKEADSETITLGGKRVRVGVSARKLTGPSTSVAVNWHGDADAAVRSSATGEVNGMGTVNVVCAPGQEAPAEVTITPNYSTSTLWEQTIEGEGDVEDHVIPQEHPFDDESRTLVPIDLPENGMVRAVWTNGGRKVELMISSWRKRNDVDATKNYCEVAIAVTPA